jgi:hypothetical protein
VAAIGHTSYTSKDLRIALEIQSGGSGGREEALRPPHTKSSLQIQNITEMLTF